MLDRLREWLDSNPNGRKALMLGGLAAFFLMIGVLITLHQGRPDSDPIPTVTVDPNSLAGEGPNNPDPPPDVAPGAEGPPGTAPEGPRRPRTAWTSEKDVPVRAQAGLNLPPVKILPQWEEVAWIQEDPPWDQVRLSDGQEVWIQSKHLTFTKPANLSHPTPAELTMMAFYQAVARKDYAAAYSYLSPPWKAELSFNDFVDGYTKTLSLRTEIARVIPLGNDRYQVDVSMIADELGRDVPYMGSYMLEKDGDSWDMASGSLNRMNTTREIRPGPAPRVPAPVQPQEQQPVAVPTETAPTGTPNNGGL